MKQGNLSRMTWKKLEAHGRSPKVSQKSHWTIFLPTVKSIKAIGIAPSSTKNSYSIEGLAILKWFPSISRKNHKVRPESVQYKIQLYKMR